MKIFWAPQTRSSAVFMRMFKMLPETKNIGDYADRCLARPALKKATEIASR